MAYVYLLYFTDSGHDYDHRSDFGVFNSKKRAEQALNRGLTLAKLYATDKDRNRLNDKHDFLFYWYHYPDADTGEDTPMLCQFNGHDISEMWVDDLVPVEANPPKKIPYGSNAASRIRTIPDKPPIRKSLRKPSRKLGV